MMPGRGGEGGEDQGRRVRAIIIGEEGGQGGGRVWEKPDAVGCEGKGGGGGVTGEWRAVILGGEREGL